MLLLENIELLGFIGFTIVVVSEAIAKRLS